MNKNRYIKDTKKFWRTRNESRVVLDKKREGDSFAQKEKIAEKLRSDANFLKKGVPVSSK